MNQYDYHIPGVGSAVEDGLVLPAETAHIINNSLNTYMTSMQSTRNKIMQCFPSLAHKDTLLCV